MIVEVKSKKFAMECVPGANVPVVLSEFVEKRSLVDASEPFDLYEWALDFSRAAGFEFDRVSEKY